MLYTGAGRSAVLKLKHADRPDLARAAAPWLARAAAPLLSDRMVIAPVPLHRLRLLKRRYNQAALLAQHLAISTGHRAILDLLLRQRATAPLDGVSAPERFERLDGAITANPRRAALCAGRPVLLVDDVMTSGATLAACAEACLAAGAARVDILTLARVAKDA